MTLVLRSATSADIPRLHAIERAAAELFRGSKLIDVSEMAVVAITDHLAAIEARLSIVADVDGRTAGFVMGVMHGQDTYLHELDVDPAFQRHGVGTALVRAFCQAARAAGAACIYLGTFREPPWNAPFYRKLGFRDVARADYLPWMTAIEAEQADFLDIETRVFMRIELRTS